jgi:hypothetical protein
MSIRQRGISVSAASAYTEASSLMTDSAAGFVRLGLVLIPIGVDGNSVAPWCALTPLGSAAAGLAGGEPRLAVVRVPARGTHDGFDAW